MEISKETNKKPRENLNILESSSASSPHTLDPDLPCEFLIQNVHFFTQCCHLQLSIRYKYTKTLLFQNTV